MAWLAINEDGTEVICEKRPKRIIVHNIDKDTLEHRWEGYSTQLGNIPLLNGTIRKIIRRKLTWRDESVEL